mgnify:CR=1 FL=1
MSGWLCWLWSWEKPRKRRCRLDPFFTFLENRIKKVDSLLCVGLDPHPEDLKELSGQALRDFCLRLVDLTAESAAAFKPNAAFFESLGGEGFRALEEAIGYIPDDIPVILDVKRGDISSTARAYAQAAFQTLGADAVTVNPYLGKDAVMPFIEDPAKGAFVLCKTSNAGAVEIQDLQVSPTGQALFVRIAQLVREWNTGDNLGLVVGATQVKSLIRVREFDPEIWILAPGVGAQGGNLGAAIKAGLREDGLGMLMPISRSISRAEDPASQARKFKEDINAARDARYQGKIKLAQDSFSAEQKAIADQLLEMGCIQFGEFTLKSGQVSPIYIDLRRLISDPAFLNRIALVYCHLLRKLDFAHLAPLPYAGLPIASAISLVGGWSMIYSRKEDKNYGTKAQVEGVFLEGDRAVVIDDLVTTGGSKLEGIQKLLENGLEVNDIVVLIDRSQDGGQELLSHGYNLHSYFTLSGLLDYYQQTGQIDPGLARQINSFLGTG